MNKAPGRGTIIGLAAVVVFSGTAQGATESPTDASASGGLEEITVTANRREERLQDVPISVAAFSAAQLNASGVQNIQDLAQITPGLTMTQQSGALTPFIRGIGAVDNTVGQEAAVSTYVDGVYYPSVYGALFTFNNIERVEVEKGPQGTLFGRNATGGLIQVITRAPSHDTELEGSAWYGNYGSSDAKFYATTGLTTDLAADLAVIYHHQSEGWGHDLFNDQQVGFLPNTAGVRNKWLYTPTDRTNISVSLDYLNSDNGDIGNAKSFVPGAVSTLDGLPAAPGFYNGRAGETSQFVNTVQWGGAVNATQEFDAFTLQSITSHRNTKVTQQFDNDATPIVGLDAYINYQIVKTTTQEFHISSPSASLIKWIGGVYWLKDESGFVGPLGLGLIGPNALLKNVIDTRSYSAFADTTIPIAADTNLTVGARWTKDKRQIQGDTDVVGASTPSARVILSIPVPPQSSDQSKPTWRLVLDHKFTDNLMVYGSYNRGFKSGNFNTVSPTDAPFQAETVDAFEIGEKAELFDRKLRINAAAFYYKYRNLQLPSLSGSFLLTTNAADSRIEGVDFDIEYLPIDQLKLAAGATYLNTKYTSFPDAQCSSRDAAGVTTQFSCDATGNELSRSPKATGFVSATYTQPTAVGKFDANVTYSYTGTFYWEPDNRLRQNAYSLTNLNLGWTMPDGHFGLDAFAKNVFNREYAVWIVGFALGDEYAAAPPRTVGAGFHFKF